MTIIANIIARHFYNYVDNPGHKTIYITYDFADLGLQNIVSAVTQVGYEGSVANHTASPVGTFTDPTDMANYYFTSSASALISALNGAQSTDTYSVGSLQVIDDSVKGAVDVKQDKHANLDKLSATSLTPGALFRMDGTADNILQVSMSDFVASFMNSVDSSALTSAMGLDNVSSFNNDANYITTTDLSSSLASYVPTSRTVNGKALSSNVALSPSDIGSPSGSGSSSGTNTGDVTLANLGSSPNAAGASISGQAITLQPADATHPGLMTATTQTIGGVKTFTGSISASNLSGANTGDQDLSVLVAKTTTVNGKALSGNITLSASDISGIPVIQAYEGATQRLNAFPIFKTGTVSSGAATVHFTADGTSGGTALFPNGIISDSVNVIVNDATAIYPCSWALSNSNKTLTITVNKAAPTGVISLLGLNLLGAPIAAANGVTIKITAWGY